MRIGVFSDTHVGRKLPLAIADLRREAYRHAFTQAIDAFIREDVDYVIHGGDLMERRSMKPEDALFVKEEFQRLIDHLGPETRIFTVRGNHDGSLENNVLDYIRHPLAEYFKVLGDQTIQGREEKHSYRGMIVAGFGYHPFIGRKLEEAKKAAEASLRGDGIRVFIIHNFVEGYHKIPPGTAQHSIIPLSILLSLPMDLLVCGHFHENLGLTKQGETLILTPGATEAINLADKGPFGIHILDIDSRKKIQDRFVKVAPLHLIQNVLVDSQEATKPLQWYVEEILREAEAYTKRLEEASSEGILRVKAKGRTGEDRLDLDWMVDQSMRRLMKEHHVLLYYDLVNDLEEVGEVLHPPPISGRKEYLQEAFKPLGELATDAFGLVEEVDVALEEEGSQRTGLLTRSKRDEYVEKWLKLLDKLEVNEK